jgi:hypothetical protein
MTRHVVVPGPVPLEHANATVEALAQAPDRAVDEHLHLGVARRGPPHLRDVPGARGVIDHHEPLRQLNTGERASPHDHAREPLELMGGRDLRTPYGLRLRKALRDGPYALRGGVWPMHTPLGVPIRVVELPCLRTVRDVPRRRHGRPAAHEYR